MAFYIDDSYYTENPNSQTTSKYTFDPETGTSSIEEVSAEELAKEALEAVSTTEQLPVYPTVTDTAEPSLGTDIKRVALSTLEAPFELASDLLVRPFANDKKQYDIDTDKKFKSVKESLLNLIGDDTEAEIAEVLDETGKTRTPDTFTGQVLDIGTYLVGGGVLFKGLGKVTKLGKATRGVIAEQTTEQLLTDPDYNMANLVQDLKKEPNAVVDYLAADKNEDVLLNRAKLVLTSGLFAGSLAAVYKLGFSKVDLESVAQKKFNKPASELTDEELPEAMGELLKSKKAKNNSRIVKEVKKVAQDDEKSVARIVDQSTNSISGKLTWIKQRWMQSSGFLSRKGFEAQQEGIASQKELISKAGHIAYRLQSFIDNVGTTAKSETLTKKIASSLESGNTKGLSKEIADEVNSARDLIDDLSSTILDNNIGGEVLRRSIEKNMGQYVRKSYRLFEDKNFVPDAALYEDAVDALVASRTKGKKGISVNALKKYEADARKNLDSLLERGEKQSFNDYIAKMQQVKKGYFKGRKDIDPAVRKLMGEIESPTENLILTAQKLGSITENHKFYNTLENLGGSTPASPTLFNSAVKAAREELRDVDIEDVQKTFKEGTYVTDLDDSLGKIIKVNKNGSYKVTFKDSITGKKKTRTIPNANEIDLVSPDKAVNRRATEIYEESGGSFTKEKYIFESKNGVFKAQIEGTGSSLDGKWTTVDMARAVNNLEDTHLFWGAFSKGLKNESAIRYFSAAKGFNQQMRTVYDHTTHLRNALGGFQFGLANGLNPIAKGRTNFNVLHNEMTKGGNKVFDNFYERLQGLGIINTSVRAGEARALLNIAAETNPAKFASRLGNHAKKYSGVNTAHKYFVKRPEDIYMATDDFFKMNAFVNELEVLKRARPKANILDLEKEAAEIIKQTFPNYDRVFKGVKALRELPVGNFVSFPAEILRTSFNIGRQGFKEITSGNKALMARGTKRLTGFATANLGYYAAGSAGWSTLGFSKQEVNALNTLNEGFSDTPKSYGRVGGELLVQDNGHIAAYAAVVDPVLEMIGKTNKGIQLGESDAVALRQGVLGGMRILTKSFTDEAMLTTAMWDLLSALKSDRNATSRGKQLWTDDSNMVEGMFTHVIDSFAPGIYLDVKRLGEAVNEVPNPTTGLTKSIPARLLEFGTGLNFRKFTPETQFTYKVKDYMGATEFKTTKAKVKFGKEPSDFFKEYTIEQSRRFEAGQELYRHVLAMQDLGFSLKIISKTLKDNGVTSFADRIALLQGKFRPRKLTPSDRFDLKVKMGNDFSTLNEIRTYTNFVSGTNLHPSSDLDIKRSGIIKDKISLENFKKRKFATGGEVDVPNAPDEPDERIDKFTGLPYNVQAGEAYRDQEDPLRRLGFMGGGAVKDPLVRLGFAEGSLLNLVESTTEAADEGFTLDTSVDASAEAENNIEYNIHADAIQKVVRSNRDLEAEVKESDQKSFFGGKRAYNMALEKIKEDKEAGKMTSFEEALRTYGAKADLIFSPIGDLLSVPLGIAGKGIKAITPDSVEESVAETVQETTQKVSEWLDQNPEFKRSAKNVNALISIAGFIPATRMLKTGVNTAASNTDLIMPNFYEKGATEFSKAKIAGTHFLMAIPKAVGDVLIPAQVARRNKTIGIRKREEIKITSNESAADMVAGVIQAKNIMEQSGNKIDDLVSKGAINKAYGYEQLSMADKAAVKNAMFNKYVNFNIPEHIQDRMLNHMYFGPHKEGVLGALTGKDRLLRNIDPNNTSIDIKNPKGIQNQAKEMHGGHSRGPSQVNRLFNVDGRAKLATVISKLNADGSVNKKFNKAQIKRDAKNIKDVDNIIANATPEQMKKALSTSWGTKGGDAGIVFKIDEKNPNTIYFQQGYKSGSKESGGVNAMIAIDLDTKQVYNMVTDKHDMLANLNPLGGSSRITGTVPTMRSFVDIKQKGGHVGRNYKEEAMLSLRQLDDNGLDIPESGILSVPTYDAVTGLIPTGKRKRTMVGAEKINRSTLEKIANSKNIEEVFNKNGDLAGYKVDGVKMSKAQLDSGVNVNASIIQHYAGKATTKDYGIVTRRLGESYMVSGESATIEEARQGRVLNALRKGAR